MIVARNRSDLTKALMSLREFGETVALVPTMGALHDGHLGLMKQASAHANHVAASIFVNPTQFAPSEDFAAYPRDEVGDLTALRQTDCALVYIPDPAEMYPPGDETRVVPGSLADPLEGASRPGFFTGVCTVVAKLFLHVQPDVAIFGEKDYQQLIVLRRMTTDLGLGVRIVGAPIARAADGLALSSRNRYLTPRERSLAAKLPETLDKVSLRIRGGVPAETALLQGLADLASYGFVNDYMDLRDERTLEAAPRRILRPGEMSALRLFVATRLGTTRLIDNRPL